MEVVSLHSYRTRETVAVLRHLLDRALRGEIQGLALAARPADGPDEVVFTDLYRRDPDRALGAALRISRESNDLAERRNLARC